MPAASRCALLAAAAVLTVTPRVEADDTSDCIAASEAAQSLRDQHLLLEARDKLAVCSRRVCPGPIRVDCVQQRVDVDAATPSVVLQARNGRGDDAGDVRVSCDGALFATQLDGKALVINPGPHTFRFEAAGAPAVERRVVIGEGEKNRLVTADLGPPSTAQEVVASTASSPASGSDATAGSAGPGTSDAPSLDRRALVGWIVGGAGVATLIPMAVLWIAGTSDLQHLRNTCAPAAGGRGCDPSRVGSDRAQLIAGDVLMGVAAAAIATGAILVFVRPADAKRAPESALLRMGAAPLPGGGLVTAGGRF